MWFKTLSLASLGLLWLQASAADTNAPIVWDNNDSVWQVQLLKKDNTTVQGHLEASPGPDNVGITIHAKFWGIPTDQQPLLYHIHKKPVPEDGNCYSTSSHLDPYGRTDTPPCDIKAPQTCEVGDLSGKHGPIWAAPGESVAVSYTDWFLSNVEDTAAFFGNLSVVVHAADNTRLTCGNFEKAD
ncbi:hypothetical protein ASPACDRAFT_42856 [Aspergillus aculeatus ATCC 16872]|uniref:superoxide dismutase n=1 Tax=Aspergillus aculeatus (strain ATCC 16872 / CBS 172.66 / WB 5094) TaxID=690307 RepID=A0A1L9WVJ4_ASPA1|nr:uncharacterized protein ASPACDRAFT_42856 [Aspergillus aculeatus ATCC 16872]OJK00271.1 hypothetical protein ASPACDRAFT_42856 [Aspergillus aculeatus ATCC 16872]